MGNSAERTDKAEEADRNAILGLLNRWRLATRAKDINAILQLVTDDVVFLPSSVPPIKGKKEVEKLYRAFFPRYREIKHEAIIEEVQIAGEWAFLWGTDELRLTPESGDKDIHMKGKGLSVLKRQSDGSWRFWRGINDMIPQPTWNSAETQTSGN
jgi:uncharacterized protein (TIGR02246 family)